MAANTNVVATCILTSGMGPSSWSTAYSFLELPANTLLGNSDGSVGLQQPITLGSGLSFVGSALTVTGQLAFEVATGTITAAQILNLIDVPAQLIPAPSGDNVINVLSYSFHFVFGTSGYSDGSNLNIQYSNSPGGSGIELATPVIPSDFMTQTNNCYFNGQGGISNQDGPTVAFDTDIQGQGVFLTVPGDNFTGGDSTLVYQLFYTIL